MDVVKHVLFAKIASLHQIEGQLGEEDEFVTDEESAANHGVDRDTKAAAKVQAALRKLLRRSRSFNGFVEIHDEAIK